MPQPIASTLASAGGSKRLALLLPRTAGHRRMVLGTMAAVEPSARVSGHRQISCGKLYLRCKRRRGFDAPSYFKARLGHTKDTHLCYNPLTPKFHWRRPIVSLFRPPNVGNKCYRRIAVELATPRGLAGRRQKPVPYDSKSSGRKTDGGLKSHEPSHVS